MKIKFTSILIENFKNIDRLETDFGNKTFVYGANETGKTTFADAISWCLTGKNSLGDSQFEFIPIQDESVSPSVTLEIDISGKKKDVVDRVILQRLYQAKLNRSKEYSGEHQTICYVNRLKVGVKEFEGWISTHICNSEIFRLIHDVRYFTENISVNGRERPWEAQRRLLFTISGIKSDYDFAKSKKRFEPIIEWLQQYTNASDYLRVLKSAESRIISDINIQREKIKSIQSLIERDQDIDENIDFQIEQLKIAKDNLDKEIEEENRKLLEERERRIASIRKLRDKKVTEFKKSQEDYSSKFKELNKKRKSLSDESNKIQFMLVGTEHDLQSEQEAYDNISIQCPTCGQYIPTEMIESKKAELEENIGIIKTTVKELENKKEEILRELSEVEKDISELKPPTYPDELRDIEQEFASAEMMNHSEQFDINVNRRAKIIAMSDELMAKKSSYDRNKKVKEEVDKIESAISDLLDVKANNSALIDLTRDFIDAKCKYAEKKVNELFEDGIEFKLFRQNKSNDEVKSCCDIFWNGVPYQALSYSTKFIVSMKIALAFQKYYKVEMPLIVDNAESIDFSFDISTQSIFLVKREEYCKCGGETGRKESDGMWVCKNCGNHIKKSLKIEIEV